MTNKEKKSAELKNPKNEYWRSVMNSNFSAVEMVADLIKYPVITEKSYFALFRNKQYTFDVDLRLNKTQIKKLFKELFEVDVVGINTHCGARQKVRVGFAQGFKPRYKRVILTLKEGQTIEFTSFNKDKK